MDWIVELEVLRAFIPRFIAGLVAAWYAGVYARAHKSDHKHWIRLKTLTWVLPIVGVVSAWRVIAYYHPSTPSEKILMRDTGIFIGTASIAFWWPACLLDWILHATIRQKKERKQNN